METLSALLTVVAIIFCVIALLKILAAPIKLIFKLLLNAALGFVILFAVNFIGGFLDFTLGFNLLNALIVGFLGLPGVVLLIVITIFF